MLGVGWLDNAKLHGFHWERFNSLVYSRCAEFHVCSNSVNSQQIVTAEALNLKQKAFDFCKQHYGNDLEIASIVFFSQNLHSTPLCIPYCNCDNRIIFVHFIFQSRILTS